MFDECKTTNFPSPGHPSRYMYPLGTHCSLAERALNCGGIGRDDQLLEALTARNRGRTGLCLDPTRPLPRPPGPLPRPPPRGVKKGEIMSQ